MNVTPLTERIARAIRQDVQSAAGYAIQPSAGHGQARRDGEPVPPAAGAAARARRAARPRRDQPLSAGKGDVAAALARHFAVPAGCR